MADEFKTFDKTPIMHVISFNKCSFGIREIILSIIAGLLLFLCLIFAGLFGNAESQLGSAPSASAIVGNSFCVDRGCLDTAARALDYMNLSVDPCENFYEYACGNYKVVNPTAPNKGGRTVLDDMYTSNQEKLETIMEKPVQRMTDWASERKLKQFFQACNDLYTREQLRGKPFLEKIVANVGGWDGIGTFNESTWDMNWALKKVQTDFWVDALYAPRIGVSWQDSSRRDIQLTPAGTGKWMYWSWYTHPYAEYMRQDYKKFIRRVGSLLQRDANLASMTDEEKGRRLDQFVNDTFTIEYNVASIARQSQFSYNHYLEANKVSLADLNTETNNVINWVDQLSYMFNAAGVNANTRVVLLRRDYYRNITGMITSLPDEDRKRMMSNYFIWRMAEIYVQELSWEYIHANREIYVDMFGRAQFMGTYRYCFSLAKKYMNDALSVLYISDHFNDKNKETVQDIADNIKKSLQDQLDSTPWMDTQTRTFAKEKLDRVTLKMGYPDWMANHDLVDSLYIGLTVNVSDAFANVLSGEQFMRAQWNKELRDGEKREEWIFNTYDTNIAVYWYWNEVIAPSGILQAPVYDSGRPHSSTFGSLGALLGKYLHYIVDEWGQHYDKDGHYMGYSASWWSNHSLKAYEEVDQCVYDIYVNQSKTYKFGGDGGPDYPIFVNTDMYIRQAIAITNGVRLALKGYKKWVAERGISEKMIPGLHLSSDQMVFLSHAQTNCFNRDNYWAFYKASHGYVEEDIRVNNALGQLQEFSDAFQCKPTSKMNHKEKCNYY